MPTEPASAGSMGSAAAAAAPFTPVGLFLTGTDAARPTWEHVWATIYKVEGLGADSKPVALFTSGEGFLVDLTQPSALPGAGVAATSLPGLTRLRLTLAPAVQASKMEQSTVETVALVPALPKDADGERVSAEFKNGVLTICVPKREEVKPKEIEVRIA